MLKIKDLSVEIEGVKILKGLNLEINKGEVHAIMGPNGSGKSTLSYVLSGRAGYEITGGDILLNGNSIIDMEADERARSGLFLAFQYPVELPGVSGMSFLRAAINARLREENQEEVDQLAFVKIVKAEAKKLGIPIIGIVDTNCDPDIIDFPIPANDDGVKSVQFILDSFKKVLIAKDDISSDESVSKNE